MIHYFSARNPDFCRICPKCVSLLTNITECKELTSRKWRSRKIAATTPPLYRIASAFGDPGKILLLPPHRIASASGDHGKDSRNSTTSTWQLCARYTVFLNDTEGPLNLSDVFVDSTCVCTLALILYS